MTITLQAPSLVEKVELVQVCSTLRLRTNIVSEYKMDVKSTWTLHGIEWIMFHGHLDYFQKLPLGGGSNTKQETMALRTQVHNSWLFYFIMCEDPHE
jgi:hypothetical protein